MYCEDCEEAVRALAARWSEERDRIEKAAPSPWSERWGRKEALDACILELRMAMGEEKP